MSTATNKLTQMIKDAPDQVAGLGSSIESVQDQIDELNEELAGVTSVCNTTEADARDLLENTIMVDKGGDSVLYGPTFGVISFGDADAEPAPIPPGNLTDWAILNVLSVPIYTYFPGDYPDLDQWVTDFAFSNDYITRPLTEGATYGLSPNISVLGTGKSILQNNQTKIGNSVDVFSRYAT